MPSWYDGDDGEVEIAEKGRTMDVLTEQPAVEQLVSTSSAIRNAWYTKPRESRLLIEFTSMERYAYYGVPEDIAQGLRESTSKGQYFAENIRGKYRYEKVS